LRQAQQLSGAVTDRPALCEALACARSGDTLIVWKLDRLARSMKQLIETIEELRLRGIGFRSLTEALDTTTAQGRLVFHMFGALAPCCMDRGCGRTEPYPCSGLCDADILRASKLQHSVQHVGGDRHLGRLSSVGLEA
jgi:Resolvase, N terminal domain